MLQRISPLIILVSMQVMLKNVEGKTHVHFKIHVPELVNHHIHTKTIYLHIHPLPKDHPKEPPKKEPPKKEPPKKNHYEESNFENWNSYSSYNNEDDHQEIDENGDILKSGQQKEKCIKGNNYQKENSDSYFPTSYENINPEDYYNELSQKNDYYNSNYNSNPNLISNSNPNFHYNQNYHSNPNYNFHPNDNPSNGYSQYDAGQDMTGYMYPPQYAIHEDVNDIPNNEVEQFDVYENGYKRGLETETGHLLTKNLKDFYDDKFEEAGEFAENDEQSENDKHISDVYQGNYDKEITHRDRSSNKNGQRRIFSSQLIFR